ncbi:MAG TPA: hypothetical protein VN887_05255, partial [Candidatus Angelobacter sp.]|nr:hypothetical protein [Candidatus Angelobacter sp.]
SISNRLGSDGTDIGAVEVDYVLRIIGVKRVGSSILLKFTSVSDKAYGLEYTPDLSAPSWVPLSELVVGTGGIVTLTNNGAGLLPAGFYRAFQQPP